VDFNVVDQPLIGYSAFIRYWRKMGEHGTVHQLFIDSKKPNNSVKREVLNNILNEFRTPIKLVRVTKMCRNKTRTEISQRKTGTLLGVRKFV
jgi:hypothetical protein